MRIIRETGIEKLPITWANLEDYSRSEAYKVEIYLRENTDIIKSLIDLFYNLFGENKQNILVYDKSWWNFTLDTWNIEKNSYKYNLNNKSRETVNYLTMLNESGIKKEYSGVCECLNWTSFLQIILPCIVSNIAVYSPIFFDRKHNFFFYFHYSGSIGLYYEKMDNIILKILNFATEKYLIE